MILMQRWPTRYWSSRSCVILSQGTLLARRRFAGLMDLLRLTLNKSPISVGQKAQGRRWHYGAGVFGGVFVACAEVAREAAECCGPEAAKRHPKEPGCAASTPCRPAR